MKLEYEQLDLNALDTLFGNCSRNKASFPFTTYLLFLEEYDNNDPFFQTRNIPIHIIRLRSNFFDLVVKKN